jgi:hypothetical protein
MLVVEILKKIFGIVKEDEIGVWRKLYNEEPRVDRLCGLVVRVSGYRSRGPGFDSHCYQIS